MQAIANFSPKTGFEPMASAFSAVMLYQLSYEDPYVGSRQTNLSSSSLPVTVTRREIKLIWTAGIQMKLRCDHRSCNHNLSNCKFYPEKKVKQLPT